MAGDRNGSRRIATLFVAGSGGANTAVLALQSVLLLPMYLQHLGARVYGAWLASGELLSWMPHADLGIPNLIIQRIGAAEAQHDDARGAAYLGTALFVCGLLAALFALIGVALALLLPHWFDLQGTTAQRLTATFAIGAVCTGVVIMHTTIYAYARAIQQTGLLSISWFASTLAGFVASLWLLFAGHGFAAIAAGFIARAVVLAFGATAFWLLHVPLRVRQSMQVDGVLLRELLRAAPITAAAGFAYALMSQSEILIVSIFLGTEIATVYLINRRAVDLTRSLADSVTWASYGSFAHLVASAERARSMSIYSEIIGARTLIAAAAAVAYVAFNASFIAVWVGREHFAGISLTLLFALHTIVVGGGFAVNYLYRATGDVVAGSRLLVLEAGVRVVLMAALASSMLGMHGVPIAGLLTATIFMVWTHRRLVHRLLAFSPRDRLAPTTYWLSIALLLVLAVVMAQRPSFASWWYVLAGGAVAASASGLLLLWIHPGLRGRFVPTRRATLAAR